MVGGFFPPVTLAFTAYEVIFVVSAVKVEARVLEVERLCTLTWKSGRKSSATSDFMDCEAAAEVRAATPKLAYRTREQVRTHLLFRDREGTRQRVWTQLSRHDGRPLQAGDTLPILFDPEDPSDVRRSKTWSDLTVPAALIDGSIVLALVGWLLKGLGRGGSPPRRSGPGSVVGRLRAARVHLNTGCSNYMK